MRTRRRTISGLGVSALALGLLLASAPRAMAQVAIPQGGWTVYSVDSAGPGYPATFAFDGNPATAWTTSWTPSVAPLPHELVINLGAAYDVNGFRHLPRQDGSPIGRIGQYEFSVSTDAINWGPAVFAGTLQNIATEETVTFPAKNGQYVRLKVLSSNAGTPYTTLAELNVLRTSVPTPLLTQVSPNAGGQGTTLNVTLTGANTHFTNSSVVTFSGFDVTAGPPTTSTPTSVIVQVTTGASAAVGARTVTVTTGAEVVSLPSGFTVTVTVTGPGGPVGPTGPTGPAGLAGPTGAVGATGAAGATGNPGTPGATGPAGGTGNPGAAGATGPAGAPGGTGAPGTPGSPGAAGPTGTAGPAGATGASGAAGATGPTGANGTNATFVDYFNGPTYLGAATGCANGGIVYVSGGVNRYVCNGAPGAPGATGPTGSGGGGGGGINVKDGTNASIGSLVTFIQSNGDDGYQVTKNGYIFFVLIDGKIMPTNTSIQFTGLSCTGTPYFSSTGVGDSRYEKNLVYSAPLNKIYGMANAVNGVATSIAPPTFQSRMTAAGSCTTPSALTGVWQLQEVAPAALGINATGSPLTVPAPVLIQ